MQQSHPSLSSNRAFVVQFRSHAAGHPAGRVEHVVSGQAVRFDSWEHLLGFIERTLAGVSEKPP